MVTAPLAPCFPLIIHEEAVCSSSHFRQSINFGNCFILSTQASLCLWPAVVFLAAKQLNEEETELYAVLDRH